MCVPGQGEVPFSSIPASGVPGSAAEAVAMAQAGLAWLASADAASLPVAVQADCLRGLERAAAMQTAAQAAVVTAFNAQAGYENDGHGSARTWLRWQTRITGSAAAGAIGWMRRLAAHPAVRAALAGGQVSASFARKICDWSDLLPGQLRAGADRILLTAALAGAELADLAGLAEEMRRRAAGPDTDSDGFEDRWVRLEETFCGAGSLSGELTPQCQAALRAVLDALGKKAGPEDTRTKAQRDHDALAEACRRLLGSACLPDRAGQPVQVQLHMTLDQLRGQDGSAAAESAWAAGISGLPAAGPGDDCDASVVPFVTGHVDRDLLDRLATALTDSKARAAAPATGTGSPASPAAPHGRSTPDHGEGPGPGEGPRAKARRERAQTAIRRLLLTWAADVLSGPDGLAAYLRTGLPEDLVASVSLPLDAGVLTETVPVHLRRAVAIRDRRCRFPGCDQPVAASQVHHIVPRSQGGPTKLTYLMLLCSFHHLVVIHRWGWQISLQSDGSVTAISPDGSRVLHDHGPPPATAA